VRSFATAAEYVVQPTLQPGDAVIFSEALVHGTAPWRATGERLALLLKYVPGHSCAATPRDGRVEPSWLSAQQRALLRGPALYGSEPLSS
jgi:ectoine hydroxylase-related dioxygenase (phytanoyl-CoA dioxygenase family)